jgi:polyribonucleotide 5'-hydroxyl-kinase
MHETSFEDENTDSQPQHKVYSLKKEEELRFEVDYKCSCTLKLLKGKAEMFGTELPIDHAFTITGSKLAVYTWEGAEIELSGEFKLAYTAEETPMASYLKIHKSLEDQRKKEGPRVLICGPVDSGKSTLCRILMSWAQRCNHAPLYVDLDVGQNQLSIPGTICAVQVRDVVSIEDGFNNVLPLVFFYGYDSPQKIEPYKKMLDRFGEVIHGKLQQDVDAKRGGIIVNTCGWVDGAGYGLIVHTIKAFKIDTVLVIGDDRLTAKLSKDVSGVQKVPKSAGVVQRSTNYRKTTRISKIREYFYGISDNLSPHIVIMSFSDIEVIQFGKVSQTPSSLLPIGQSSQVDPLTAKTVDLNEQLVHSVLGVSYATSKEEVLSNNVLGFVFVSHMDVLKKEITFLAPAPGKLPKKYLILGNIKWVDQQ